MNPDGTTRSLWPEEIEESFERPDCKAYFDQRRRYLERNPDVKQMMLDEARKSRERNPSKKPDWIGLWAVLSLVLICVAELLIGGIRLVRRRLSPESPGQS